MSENSTADNIAPDDRLKDRLDWLREIERCSRQLLRVARKGCIKQATCAVAGAQIYEVLMAVDPVQLKEALSADIGLYARLITTLARLSEGDLKYDRYRQEVAEKKAVMQQRITGGRTADRGLTPEALAEIETMLRLL